MNRAVALLSGLALLIALAPAAPSAAEPATRRRGLLLGPSVTLLKVEKESITVRLAPTNRERAKERTLKLVPEETQVFIGEIEEERVEEDGRRTVTVRFKPGKLADLKAGQRAMISADEDVAVEIRLMPMPPLPPKKGEEKGK